MSDNNQLPGMNFEPEREKTIHDIELLRVYFDPMRLRIIQEVADQARSIHEIADILGIHFRRLYYHMGLLEKSEFIKVVDIRQGAGAIEEKYYRVSARLFLIDHKLLTAGTPAGDAGLETMLTTVLDETKRSIYAGIDAGVIDMTQRAPHPDALVMMRGVFSMPDEMATEFQMRLKALIIEFNGREVETTPQTKQYNFIVALHPTLLEDRQDVGIDLDLD